MAYIGRAPLSGDFRKIDSIEAQFNSNTNTFAITYLTEAVIPGSPYVMIAVLDGQVLEPAVDYNVNGNNLLFTNAPNAAQSFHAIILGNTGTAVSTGGSGIASINNLTGNNLTLNNVTINGSIVSNVLLNNTTGNVILTNSVLGSNVSGTLEGTINNGTITNTVLGSNVTGIIANATITNTVLGSNVTGNIANATIINTVLGSNVTGNIANVTITNSAISNAYVSSYKELITNLGNIGTAAGATVNIDLSQGNIYRANLIGNVTFTFTNHPTVPFTMPITLIATQVFGSNTINVTSAVYTENALPQLSILAGNTDVLTFFSPNGGVRYIGTHAISDVII